MFSYSGMCPKCGGAMFDGECLMCRYGGRERGRKTFSSNSKTEAESMKIDVSEVELALLRDTLANYASEAICGLYTWAVLNSLLEKVGAEPRVFAADSSYGTVSAGVGCRLSSAGALPGFVVKSDHNYLAAFGGWTSRLDCARVFDRAHAESERDFYLEVLGHRGGLDICPVAAE